MTLRFVSKLPEKFTDNATIPGDPEHQAALREITEILSKLVQDAKNEDFEIETNYSDMNYRGLDSLNETLVGVNGVLQLRRGTSKALFFFGLIS